MSRYSTLIGLESRIGMTVWYDGQRYDCVDLRFQYSERQQRDVLLFDWESRCADCNAPFGFCTGLKLYSFNRRCETHKSPLKRVNGRKRGHRNSVEVIA